MANEFTDTNITGDLAVTGTITGDGSGLTGLPGGGDMTLAGVQTVTGAKSFDDGKLIVKGSTSGTTTIKADATAGTTVATLPAATGTIAYSTVPYGGTGAATFTDGGVIIGNGTGALQVTSAGTSGYVLTSNGAGVDPTFQVASGGGITALTGDVTASGTGSVAATIAAGAVDIAMLSATGTPSSSTYLRGDNSWATVSGTGDVVGPASATDNAVVRFDSTTGKLIQNSAVTIADTSGNMAGVGTLNTHTIPGGTSTLAILTNKLDAFAATTSAELKTVISDETGTGALVFATSPTLVTPALGTPASGTLTNCTGLPVTGLASSTSADLRGVLSDETGTGAAVFATSPTLVTPILGTPTSGTLTNCTGLPVTGLASSTSANLRTVLSDETGTGVAVFNDTPTLIAPLLGTPTSGTLTNCTGLPLSTGVTGDLPLANIAQIAQNTIAGRAISAGTGDITALTPLQVRTILQTPTAVTSTTNSVAWNSDNAQAFTHTLTENTTIAASSGTPFEGQIVTFQILQHASAAKTLAWNAQFTAGATFSNTIPAMATTLSARSRYLFRYDGTLTKFTLLAHEEH